MTRGFRKTILAGLAALAAIVGGLTLSGSVEAAGPGLGPNPGKPVGTPFKLPEGLEIAGPIVGAKETSENGKLVARCPDGTKFEGPKHAVQACIPVCNWAVSENGTIFPPGLIVTSAAELFQNGLIVERTVVRVPPKNCVDSMGYKNPDPKEEEKRKMAPEGAVWVPVNAYCLNIDKNESEAEAVYSLGPVTTDPQLLKVLAVVKNRKAREKKEVDAIQRAIYAATDWNEPIDPRYLAVIKTIPAVE